MARKGAHVSQFFHARNTISSVNLENRFPRFEGCQAFRSIGLLLLFIIHLILSVFARDQFKRSCNRLWHSLFPFWHRLPSVPHLWRKKILFMKNKIKESFRNFFKTFCFHSKCFPGWKQFLRNKVSCFCNVIFFINWFHVSSGTRGALPPLPFPYVLGRKF